MNRFDIEQMRKRIERLETIIKDKDEVLAEVENNLELAICAGSTGNFIVDAHRICKEAIALCPLCVGKTGSE